MNDYGLQPHRTTALAELHDYFDYQPQPYLAVLRYVYVYGYVTATQLRQIDPAIKTASRYLAALKQLGLVTTKPRVMRHEPLIYHVSTRGLAYLKTRKNRFPLISHRHESIKPAQLEHDLAVTDVMAAVTAWARTDPSLAIAQLDRRLFHAQNRITYTVEENGDKKKTSRLVADFKALLLRQRGELRFPFQFYFEVEMGTHDMRTVRAKVAGYQQWYEERGAGELATLFQQTTNLNRPAPTYRLAFVVKDRRGNDFRALSRYATHIRRVSPRPQVYVTTFEILRNTRDSGSYGLWYPLESLSDPTGGSERQRYDDMEAQLRKVDPIPLIPDQIDTPAAAVAG